jgi:hypothetical protein
MAELPQSRLRREPVYWEALAGKIREDAAGPLATYAASAIAAEAGLQQEAWDAVLARRAPWLVAASAATALVLWLALPARVPAQGVLWLERSVTPAEIAGSLVGGPVAPSVDALMVQFPPTDEGRR